MAYPPPSPPRPTSYKNIGNLLHREKKTKRDEGEVTYELA
jgi:hypothetical protein